MDHQIEQAFVYNHNQANSVTFAQQALSMAKDGQVKGSFVGPMISRKKLQKNYELLKVANKTNDSTGLSSAMNRSVNTQAEVGVESISCQGPK